VFCKSASSPNKFVGSCNLFVKLLNFPPNLDRKRAGSLQQAGGHAEIPRGRRGQQPGDGEDHRFGQGNFWRENREFLMKFDSKIAATCSAARSSSTM
jgi:hypothetical protein